ncbi:MAG: BamA/TamA family outer membrane protein [Myxococcales bacterium]|nr:BamA/TamA family outer membrane protein [Myxococcales bacterium]
MGAAPRLLVCLAGACLWVSAGARAQSAEAFPVASGQASALAPTEGSQESAGTAAEAASSSEAEEAAATETEDTPAPLPSGVERREVPDYDGRPDDAASAGEVLLWVPRVALYPLYLVSEMVVRRPLGVLVTAAEKGRWVALMTDFFTFNDAHTVGIVPTAYWEFGFKPSVGLYFFADDVIADGNDLRLHGAIWPGGFQSVTVMDRISSPGGDYQLALRGGLEMRPDYAYFGLGAENSADDRARYAGQSYEAALVFEAAFWRASRVVWELGPRHRDFDAETGYDTISLAEAVADPAHPIDALPPGFAGGYAIWRSGLSLSIDSRRAFPASASGLRMELRGEHAFDLKHASRRHFVGYGAGVGGFFDVYNQRTVGLIIDLDFVDPLAGQVPFTELVQLGGVESMQGFTSGQLLDRSSARARIEYRWPVWIWADMALHYALGNVFGEHLAGFEFERLRSSFGLGLRSARTSRPDHALRIVVAFGTRPLEEGFAIDNVRFVVGGRRGF